MSYQWDSSLETGYEKIDNQHKQLIAAVNNLLDTNATVASEQAVLDTMEFLAGYVIKHFSDEEKLQDEFNYPEYLNHRKIHEGFRKRVDDLVQQVKEEGPTQANIADVSFTIGSWLVNHIKGDDFRMAAFIKAADTSQAN